MGKYDTGSSEGEFQSGGEEGVLKNIPGLLSTRDIADAETELLEEIYLDVLNHLPDSVLFADLKVWHRRWLGNLYEWAGDLRSVNMSKGDFHFAAAGQLPSLVLSFERDYLSQFEHLTSMPVDELYQHLAETHVEFILIHPFREGNGRLSRLLMNAQVLKAGFM